MSIFLGTGMAEPRTTVRHLMTSGAKNLEDLELIQLVSIGDAVWDQVALNVASLIEDESCLAFSIGPLYEALAKQLVKKRHLGIHSPFFTDPLMDLMQSGTSKDLLPKSYILILAVL